MGVSSLKTELRRLIEKDDDLRRWLVLTIVESITKDDTLRTSFVTAVRDGDVMKEIESLREHTDGCFKVVDRRFEAVIQEIAALRQDMDRRFEAVDRRFEAIIQENAALRQDMDRRFEAVERRFEAIIQENAALRQDMDRRFEAVERRFEAIIQENAALRQDMDRRFEAVDRRFEALIQENAALRQDMDRRFEAMERRFEAVERRFEAVDRRFEALINEMKQMRLDFREELDSRHKDLRSWVASIGSRWGYDAEEACRNVFRKVIEERFGVAVKKWRRRDEECIVEPDPSDVEVDIVVTDSYHILIDFTSRARVWDLRRFVRIGRLYKKAEGVDVKLILCTFSADPPILHTASHLGIEVCTHD